jgi:predicted SprT family Zn-dependent metalloprotease
VKRKKVRRDLYFELAPLKRVIGELIETEDDPSKYIMRVHYTLVFDEEMIPVIAHELLHYFVSKKWVLLRNVHDKDEEEERVAERFQMMLKKLIGLAKQEKSRYEETKKHSKR